MTAKIINFKRERGVKNLFANYKLDAKRRSLHWGLTIQRFKHLTTQNCAYCNTPPGQIRYGYLYNGIDRINHQVGYIIDNCVSCCGTCNRIRGHDYLTFKEMKVAMGAVLKFRELSSP